MYGLRLEVDPGMLGPYLGASAGNSTPEQQRRNREHFTAIANEQRERVFQDYGLMLPLLHLDIGGDLTAGQYRVFVRDHELRSGQLRSGSILAVTNTSVLGMFNIPAIARDRHPIDRRTGAWVDGRIAGLDSLRHLGVELLNPAHFLVLESVGAAFEVIEELFGLDEARSLLEEVESRHEHLVREVMTGEMLSVSEFAEILRRLVRERVSIRDLKLILEGIAEFDALNSKREDRQDWLTELHTFLRIVLSRGIVRSALGPGDVLRAFVLSSDVEDEFRSAVSLWDHSRSKPPLDPDFEEELRVVSSRMFTPAVERGAVPIVILCPADIRPAVQDFFSRRIGSPDWIRALAYQELGSHVRPESIGTLGLTS
jgi:type III secretory pathway component EscV